MHGKMSFKPVPTVSDVFDEDSRLAKKWDVRYRLAKGRLGEQQQQHAPSLQLADWDNSQALHTVSCRAAYDVELRGSSKAASMKFRHGSNAAEATPGPSDYKTQDGKLCACQTVKGYTMGQRSAVQH